MAKSGFELYSMDLVSAMDPCLPCSAFYEMNALKERLSVS